MAVYDLEEQDQLDDLKAWWNRWGNTVTAIAVAACLALAAVQGWRWWSVRQAEEAAALFAGLSQAARANDLPKAKDATAQLEDRFARQRLRVARGARAREAAATTAATRPARARSCSGWSTAPTRPS